MPRDPAIDRISSATPAGRGAGSSGRSTSSDSSRTRQAMRVASSESLASSSSTCPPTISDSLPISPFASGRSNTQHLPTPSTITAQGMGCTRSSDVSAAGLSVHLQAFSIRLLAGPARHQTSRPRQHPVTALPCLVHPGDGAGRSALALPCLRLRPPLNTPFPRASQNGNGAPRVLSS